MPKSAMPTADDLRRYLSSAKLLDSPMTADQSLIDFDQVMASAVVEWESRTYQPFLAPTANTVRYYDPPGPERQASRLYAQLGSRGGGQQLFFNGGYVSVTEVRKNLSATNTTGMVLTANQDYWLMPMNAPDETSPYRWIEFASPVYGVPGSIKITGKPGYWTNVADDVFTAVLYMAALELLPSLELAKTGGASEVRQGPMTVKYGVGRGQSAFAGQAALWEKRIAQAFGRYGRKGMA